jgi:hypothetical protein
MRNLDFRWFDLAVRATVPDGGPLLPFLAAYFEPVIELAPVSNHAPLATLNAEIGPRPKAASPTSNGVPIVVDGSRGFLKCDGLLVEESGIRWVELSPFDVLLRQQGSQIHLWAEDEASLRIPVLRVVEDLLLYEAQRRGAIILHASAVVVDGSAVLFVGNKGAGKTTAMIRSLEHFDAALLANDNVCMVPTNDGFLARAWPAFLKVEVGTAASTRALAATVPSLVRPWLADDSALWDIYEKVALYPSEVAARLGTRLHVEAPLGALVLPRFDPNQAPGLRLASADELADAYLQGVFNPNHPGWLGSQDGDQLPLREAMGAALTALRAWITERDIPIYALNWAPALTDLLGRVPLLRAAHRYHRLVGLESHGEGPPLPEAQEEPRLSFKSERGSNAR